MTTVVLTTEEAAQALLECAKRKLSGNIPIGIVQVESRRGKVSVACTYNSMDKCYRFSTAQATDFPNSTNTRDQES